MSGAALPNRRDAGIRYEEFKINHRVATVKKNLDLVPMYNIHQEGSDNRKGGLNGSLRPPWAHRAFRSQGSRKSRWTVVHRCSDSTIEPM